MLTRRVLAAITHRPLVGWTGLGFGLAAVNVNWRSIAHQSTRYIQLPVTPHAIHSAQQGLFSALSSSSTDTMTSLTPPQPSLKWTHTAEDVMRLTKEAIEKDRDLLDKVAALPPSDCNMASVCNFVSGVIED